jgi:hypothetical protein
VAVAAVQRRGRGSPRWDGGWRGCRSTPGWAG